jgi:hypothetical protein
LTSLSASHFRRPITEAVPEIVDVVDVTDHAAGAIRTSRRPRSSVGRPASAELAARPVDPLMGLRDAASRGSQRGWAP